MIDKLLYIKNCGRFINCTISPNYWDGTFSKINTIYAENGSGKTTFTQILKSLSGSQVDIENVSKRKSLQTSQNINISFMINHKATIYNNGRWNHNVDKIEVYDTYYAESNSYIISLGNYENPTGFFDIILPYCNKDLMPNLKIAIKHCQNLRNSIKTLQENIKKNKRTPIENELKLRLARLRLVREQWLKKRLTIEKELDNLVEQYGEKYLTAVNKYLSKFNPNLKLVKLNKKGRQLVYHLLINDIEARTDSSSISLKHSLSEGDKSSLALSFFLARIELLPDIAERIIVFDDPLSSFDTRRRNITTSILNRLAEKSAQFFLLSHDLNFVKDFCGKVPDCTNLKIVWSNSSSRFIKNDIELETMTGISKDIHVLRKYLEKGAISDIERRDVIRCMRPVIEGIFRLKYYDVVTDNEWLGNFLDHIRKCDSQSPLHRLKGSIYDTISDINEYCKTYHHSNPKYMEEQIYDNELRQYVTSCLKIIQLL
uniref:AAA family ATPase n=1 Tax=Alistipes sp. Marseille-P5061 TaxID=2048242 RepID=UPI000D101A5F|nr:AAA family ATPase [Alistipes sp. Marseille-P5061]